MTYDRFYTPGPMAANLVESIAGSVQSCVDPACGSGALLRAAEDRFGSTQCMGIDIDRSAITRARRRAPHWTLSVGDIMAPASRSRTEVLAKALRTDLVVCNPPFSMGARKGIFTEFLPQTRTSVAMAHLLAAMELFAPRVGLAAVVPESLMHSELDSPGRNRLATYGGLSVVSEGRNTAFSGARVNTLLITLVRDSRLRPSASPQRSADLPCDLIRGGLPIHEADRLLYGTPLIHTTDFSALHGMEARRLRRVRRINRGVTSGHVILLPRVGLPNKDHCRPLYLRDTVQLSDCVFALRFTSGKRAASAAARIRYWFTSLSSLYRGTGARYVSQQRLSQWLSDVGFSISNG